MVLYFAENGISGAPLADLFDSLDKARAADPQRELPRSMSASMAYVDSHPASGERGEQLRQAPRP